MTFSPHWFSEFTNLPQKTEMLIQTKCRVKAHISVSVWQKQQLIQAVIGVLNEPKFTSQYLADGV